MRHCHQRVICKHIGKSDHYKHVYLITIGGDPTIRFHARIQVRQPIVKWKWSATFETEREAAIAVDKKLIEKGLEPVNILKKK